ncbi:MAG: UDP-N-acetylglucosamine 2-epimerase (non-hydrolyzing) [Oscillospiraceae bacterium]|nr:UDP-N-acetylglucosamine 2-epimerase (non-hydrolyzing) [Oscillospiraceae bacterium]
MPVILSVFGTRPEAVKMCPLVREIARRPGLQGLVCVTAQHRQMLDQVLDAFNVAPDFDLGLMRPGQTPATLTADILSAMGRVLEKTRPDLVLVHGDTTTSFAAALAAFYHRAPVGHVEAGLRSFNPSSPYPEEMNRRLTSRIASLHFAPTCENRCNLTAEGIAQGVFVTGNTVIDALQAIVRPDYTFNSPALRALDLANRRTLLLTAHRRENLGQPLRQIFQAVRDLALAHPDVQVVYPLHMNPAVAEPAREALGNIPGVHLLPPLDVCDMHNLMARCTLVLTDSGGLQEEAPALGKPVLVLRTETERPEAVRAGTARLAGVLTQDIYRETERLLCDPVAYAAMAHAVNPYGDGTASQKICDAIETYFGRTVSEPEPPMATAVSEGILA